MVYLYIYLQPKKTMSEMKLILMEKFFNDNDFFNNLHCQQSMYIYNTDTHAHTHTHRWMDGWMD